MEKILSNNDKSNDNGYLTPDGKGSFLAKFFPGWVLYTNIAGVFWGSWWQIKRGNYDQSDWGQSSCRILQSAEKAGLRVHIQGIEYVQQQSEAGPCLFLANHMSTFETFLLPCMIQSYTNLSFVVKKSLMDYPIFSEILGTCNPITVSQENPREDFKAMLDGAIERLNSGVSVLIFPQGERTNTFNRNKFNTIGIKIAKKAQVPIIPIALKSDAWAIGKILPDFGKIDPSKSTHFVFGEPITLEGNGKAQHAQILDFVEGYLKQWECTIVTNGDSNADTNS